MYAWFGNIKCKEIKTEAQNQEDVEDSIKHDRILSQYYYNKQ